MRVALRGKDHAGAPALPVGEALHPLTLLALLLLVVNDWLLKPRFGPSLVTGKLSDLAGLVCAPVLLTAAIGLVLRLVRVDPRLTRRRLIACIVATGACFAAVKLSPDAAALLVRLLSALGRPAEIYLDPTDLFCLPALGIAYAIGVDEIRRIDAARSTRAGWSRGRSATRPRRPR